MTPFDFPRALNLMKLNNRSDCRKSAGWDIEKAGISSEPLSELLGVAYTQIRNPDSNLSLLGRS